MRLEEIENDPCWFPDRLSPDLRTITFVRVIRRALIDSPFLDQRLLVEPREEISIDLTHSDPAAATVRLTANTRPPAFIFHTSFCSSTLLARALQADGASLPLKEPRILFDAANMLRAPEKQVDQRTKQVIAGLVLGLVNRRFDPAERIVLKPTNLANNWLRYAIASGCPVLLMYSELKSFLISVLMRNEPGRLFARSIFSTLVQEGTPIAKIPLAQVLLFTDAQIAALAWRQQMELFAAAVSSAPRGQVKTLWSEDFRSRPQETVHAAFVHFDTSLSPDAVSIAASHALFGANAKHPGQAFDREENAGKRLAFETSFAETLADTLEWARTLRLAYDLEFPLGNPLLSVAYKRE